MRLLNSIMKKIFLLAAVFYLTSNLYAQVDSLPHEPTTAAPKTPKPHKKQYNLSNRAKDHFIIQLGGLNWIGKPDSIHTKGLPRTINAYFMFDFPFKTTPQISAAIGLGVGSDRMYFDSSFVDVKGTGQLLKFEKNPYGNNTVFKKTSLNTSYLEVPVELRFTGDPENADGSFKFALGVKVGTMIKAGTRNRNLRGSPYATDYLLKESSKKYFNTTRIAGTTRLGFGHFTIFGSYQFTTLLKEGAGAHIHPVSIGLSFGGL